MLKIYVDGSAKGVILGAGLVLKDSKGNIAHLNKWKKSLYADGNLGEIFAIRTAINQVLNFDDKEVIIFCDNPMVVTEINSQQRIIKTQLYKMEALKIRKLLSYLNRRGFNISIEKYGKCMKNKQMNMLQKSHHLARESYKNVEKSLLAKKPLIQTKDEICLLCLD